MKREIVNSIVIVFLCLIYTTAVVSCGGTEEPDGPDAPVDVERTVLVYQVANKTGLDSYSLMDIKEMVEGMREGNFSSATRLLVYNHANDKQPVLLDVSSDGLDTLKFYDTKVMSVQAERMLEVFDDMEEYAPASDYGLILWGHGSGWLQDGISDAVPEHRRSYGGEERKYWMNGSTLAKVLELSPGFSFVYFDCCFMASVELMYELRNVTPYIAASVSEIPGEGMPYERNLGYFFAPGEADIIGAAASTFRFYEEWKELGSRPGYSPAGFAGRNTTMSVISTAGLEKLAEATKVIYERTPTSYPDGFVPQRFDRRPLNSAYYFDFGQYVEALCLKGGDELFEGAADALASFRKAMSECVAYQATLPMIFNDDFAVNYHSGLSTFILRNESLVNSNNYNTLEWYNDVASYVNIKN